MTHPMIREAEAGDIPAMCDLLEALFSIESDFRPDRARQQRGLELLLARHNSACVLVAEQAGKVVGLCTAQILISTAEGGPVGLVEDMVVRADYRGAGIGPQLLAAIETWAREHGLTRLQLLADRDNAPALRFYEKLQWQPTRLMAYRKQ